MKLSPDAVDTHVMNTMQRNQIIDVHEFRYV